MRLVAGVGIVLLVVGMRPRGVGGAEDVPFFLPDDDAVMAW